MVSGTSCGIGYRVYLKLIITDQPCHPRPRSSIKQKRRKSHLMQRHQSFVRIPTMPFTANYLSSPTWSLPILS